MEGWKDNDPIGKRQGQENARCPPPHPCQGPASHPAALPPSHSPEFLESAGGMSQPLTQQGHASVPQVIKAQVQLPKVGAEPQHSRETLTGCRAEPANAEPGKTLSAGESWLITSEIFWGKERGWTLVPPPGIESRSSAVKAGSPNDWTTRKFPDVFSLMGLKTLLY